MYTVEVIGHNFDVLVDTIDSKHTSLQGGIELETFGYWLLVGNNDVSPVVVLRFPSPLHQGPKCKHRAEKDGEDDKEDAGARVAARTRWNPS